MAPNAARSPLDSVDVNYYGTASRSCQAKVDVTAKRIQEYLDDLQTKLCLPPVQFASMGETGGSFSTDDDDVTKWWFLFFGEQPAFWMGLRKANGEVYAAGTLERYMPCIKNQLLQRFTLSRYRMLIENAYTTALRSLKGSIKEMKKSLGPPKDKVYR